MSAADRSNPPQRPTILLRGNYAEGNFGDDALVIATARLLARFSSQLDDDGSVAYEDDRLSNLEIGKRDRVRSDVIVYGGGTQFFAFGDCAPPEPNSLPARALRKLLHPGSIVHSLRARWQFWQEARTPRLAIGFGIGPFSANNPAESATADVLRGMSLVWVRDDASMAFCERHEIDVALRSADLCFTRAFASAVRSPERAQANEEHSARPRRVGIVLRDWRGWDGEYFTMALEAARRLRAQSIETTFFSFSPSDHRLLQALQGAEFSVALWRCENGEFEAFWSTLSQMELVVTARFHGAVFALLSKVPFMTIEIEPKLESVRSWATASDEPDLTISAEPEPELIVSRIIAGLNQAPQRRAAARSMLIEQRRLAAIGEQRLEDWFAESARG